MLIIAQPKSASTSFLFSLAKCSGIKAINGKSKTGKDKLCPGFEELQKYHTTTHLRDFKILQYYCRAKGLIYKDHILPIPAHFEALKNERFIILLRNPEHTIDNYERLIKKYQSGKLLKNEIKELKLELLTSIDLNKFYDDIRLFNKLWDEFPGGYKIDYNTLVMCPKNTILRSLKYFKLPLVKNPELLKSKGNHGYNTYTGVGFERAQKEYKESNN